MQKLYFLVIALITIQINGNEINQDKICKCSDHGQCLTNKQNQPYCNCQHEYIDKFCQQISNELSEKQLLANINEQYSFYFIQFNISTLYYVQFNFCPTMFADDTVFYVHIQIQKEDGSLEESPSPSDLHSFKPLPKQCLAVKFILLPYKLKYNEELARMVVRVKAVNLNQFQNETMQIKINNQMKIASYVYEFYKMQGNQLHDFLAVSIFSMIFMFLVTFAICKRLIRRRIRRFVYQAASEVHSSNNTNHFDTLMPSSYFEPSLINQQEKDCMICLLSVNNTQIRVTPCSHLYHKDCIDEWGHKSLTCPTCRSDLSPKSNQSVASLSD